MTENFPFWLTNEMVRGVSGFHLDAYLMALEGWRRGLTLKWYYDPSVETDLKVIGRDPLGTVFSLESNGKTHFFQRSRGDFVQNEAVHIASDKQIAKEYFLKANVAVPQGERFTSQATKDEMIQYGLSLGFPLVVKPTFGSLGEGVSVNIQTEEDLKASIEHIYEIGYDDIIIERFFKGEDVRVYVVDGEVIAATERVPAHVIGDGVQTIEQLIVEKNNIRKESPYLMKRLIPIDDDLLNFIGENGLSLQSIPTKDERVFLREVVNVCKGGDPIDITDEVIPELKELAVNAVQAIPGLVHGGVDILFNGREAVVIEINPTAVIGMHLFPIKGKSRNIPEALIDYYFPETIGMAKDRTDLHFDYQKIYNMIRNGVAQKVKVRDVIDESVFAVAE